MAALEILLAITFGTLPEQNSENILTSMAAPDTNVHMLYTGGRPNKDCQSTLHQQPDEKTTSKRHP